MKSNAPALAMVYVISCLTTPSPAARGKGAKVLDDRCQPIRVPMCTTMPYNLTSFPNFLGHQNQTDVMVAMEQYSLARWTQCSPYLAFLLCSIYVPLCTFDFTSEPIPPCREVCEAIVEDCGDVQELLGFPWPPILNCNQFPPKDGGVCIAPETEVVSTPSTRGLLLADGQDTECRCVKIPRLKKRLYYRSDFKYALRGRSKAITIFGELTVINVVVYEVFKQTKIRILPNSEYTLWTNSSCLCPRIELGREYLLLGYEDVENQRLLHLYDSIAIEWHKKYADKILIWEKAAGTSSLSIIRSKDSADKRNRRHKKKITRLRM